METRKGTRVFEIRAAQGEEFVLAGRALSYNEISSTEIIPGIREKLMPGCFRASLASGTDVVCLFNHMAQTLLPLGRTQNGTLTLSDTASGLNFRCELDKNNSQHRDIYAAVQRRDISSCSFCFFCDDEDFQDASYEGKSCQVRCVKTARLLDVSVVTSPFYGNNATAVAARAADATGDTERRQRAEEIGKQIIADRIKAALQAGEDDKVWLKRLEEVPNN